MNWLDVTTTSLDGARLATGLAINWLIQSTLLIAVGLAVGYWLRDRGSAVQSAIYRTTLVAVLACPFATWGLSRLGVSGWSLGMPLAYSVQEPIPTIESAPQSSTQAAESLIESGAVIDRRSSLPAFSPATELSSLVPPSDVPQVRNLPPEVASVESSVLPVATAVDGPLLGMHRFGWIAAAMAALWCAASTWLCVRLANSLRQVYRLRRSARPAAQQTIDACHQLATRLSITPPEVLQSPYLPSPCLAGLRRPAVMLPETELSLPVRDVLVHELAHLCAKRLFLEFAASIGHGRSILPAAVVETFASDGSDGGRGLRRLRRAVWRRPAAVRASACRYCEFIAGAPGHRRCRHCVVSVDAGFPCVANSGYIAIAVDARWQLASNDRARSGPRGHAARWAGGPELSTDDRGCGF